jgi:hypothetical protein
MTRPFRRGMFSRIELVMGLAGRLRLGNAGYTGPVRLLVGVVAATHQRRRGSMREPHGLGFSLQHGEDVGMHIAQNRQMVPEGARYWPMVSISTPWARRSRKVSRISSSVSPRPTISPDLVGTPGTSRLEGREQL